MIPKIIHYIWLGNKPFSRISKKCIKSWHKHCPNYRFVLWNETNLPIFDYEFSKKAYANKKYAFVSDIMRLYILSKYGGIYLDTDVEIIRPIDNLLTSNVFFGFEDTKYVNCAIAGCEPNNKDINNLLHMYAKKDFNINNLDQDTIPVNITNYFLNIGLKQNGSIQNINNRMFYSPDYFYPKNFNTGIVNITYNTYSIHHWAASWADQKIMRKRKLMQFILKHKTFKRIIKFILK